MSNPAHKIDPPLPVEIADAMEAAGLSPRLATLMATIDEFRRMKADAAKAPSEDKRPLEKLLPDGVKYERARRAAKRGELQAEKPYGRWQSTESWVAAWLPTIGWRR